MTITRDIGADLNTQAGALEELLFDEDIALQSKIDAFNQHGGLWVGPEVHDYLGLDEAQEAVYAGEDYSQWFQRKKLCRTGREVEAIQAEYSELFRKWLTEAIKDIARRSIVCDEKAYREDAA